jgi:hypothetical protein
MNWLISNYQPIITVIGSLTGLIVTFYSKYRDSNIREKELDLKKQHFESEKKHQISKETYQKIFDQKLLLYKKLHSTLLQYNNRLHDIGIEINLGYTSEVITEDAIAVKSLTDILSLLEENIFYLSENLEAEYRKINDSYKKALYDFEADKQLGVYGHNEYVEDEALMHSNSRFYENHKDDMNHLFNLIEQEIKQIKRDIGFI